MLSDRAVIRIASDVLASELGSEIVMLNLRDATYYGLDDVGAEIWRLLQTPTTIERIVDAIVDTHEVDRERCRGDVRNLLSELADRGLVEVGDPA